MSNPATFDSLPAELHSTICAFANTGDGYTIRSLRLVSKHLHEVAEPQRFHILFISEKTPLPQLRQLLGAVEWSDELQARVEGAPSRAKYAVHHLYIGRHQDNINQSAQLDLLDIIYYSRVLRSLWILPPHEGFYPLLLTNILLAPWPSLRELTLNGYIYGNQELRITNPWEKEMSRAGTLGTPLPPGEDRFPVLSHLSLIKPNFPLFCTHFENGGFKFVQHFPGVTHFAIFRSTQSSAMKDPAASTGYDSYRQSALYAALSRDIAGSASTSNAPTPQSVEDSPFPQSLTTIILHSEEDNEELYKRIADAQSLGGGPHWNLHLTEPIFDHDSLKRMWIDRHNGRPGLWPIEG